MLLKPQGASTKRLRVVVVGGSAGGSLVLRALVESLPRGFEPPVLAVLHRHPSTDESLAEYLGSDARVVVHEPCDKQGIASGTVYLAPANYHMLLEEDGSIQLSVDEKVNWSRPSIDVLFESAARAFGEAVVGIVLSGANSDGAEGIRAIRGVGGETIAQDPVEAAFARMPQAAIDTGCVGRILTQSEIVKYLSGIAG